MYRGKPIVAAIAISILLSIAARASEADGVAEYLAEYEVLYKGRHMADAEFSVAPESPDGYLFQSSTRARGLLKLASPRPAIERSRFHVTGGKLRPDTFEYEDGSRKGEDNYSVAFDASGGTIRIFGLTGVNAIPFEHSLLDRGSLQVALMRDLAACRQPGPYRYVDDDGINTYDFARLENLATETGIGMVQTVRFEQTREGSSRRTVLWLAPEYAYLPVRIEQFRNGEIETVFALEHLSGVTRTESSCSGFR